MSERGLTLGKFAPPHRSHQWLIETGLAETDEMIVVYDAPEITAIPLVPSLMRGDSMPATIIGGSESGTR